MPGSIYPISPPGWAVKMAQRSITKARVVGQPYSKEGCEAQTIQTLTEFRLSAGAGWASGTQRKRGFWYNLAQTKADTITLSLWDNAENKLEAYKRQEL